MSQGFDLVKAIGDAFALVLKGWSDTVATTTATGSADLVRPVIQWMRTSTTFVTSTPLDLVNVLSNTIGLTAIQPLLQAVTGTALLIAAVSYAGHHWWGWPGLDESLQRVGVTVVLVGSCFQLLDFSLSLFDSLVGDLAAQIPDVPGLDGLNPIVMVVLLIIWAILLARLIFVCAKRIAWLAVLKTLAPLALMTWMHSKSAWIATVFVRLWVGWLIGQLIVVMAMVLAVALVALGGFAGYILSCACLAVAHDAVYLFAPKDAGPSVSLGPIRLGM
jgi:hypothetical protein